MRLSNDTKLIGLIGNPVAHSISPFIHNKLYKDLNMDYAYIPFKIEPNSILEAVEGMVALSFVGFNVTIPYKQKILQFLDDLDDGARLIGAVNTVKIENGRLKGYNTDGMGFINGLKRLGFSPNGKKGAILGAGGAARAISVSLLAEGLDRLYILNRTHKKAIDLAEELNREFGLDIALPISRSKLDNLKLDLIVNTTSVGMYPYIDQNPLEQFIFEPSTVVVDIIYNPSETQFLAEARKQGCVIQNGLDMLIGQALESIKIWTGKNISTDRCRKILKYNDLLIRL